MLMIESRLKSSDNAGGILFTCTRIFGGFKRRYAKLGEMIGAVSYTRKSYPQTTDKLKLTRLGRRVKKKRKIKNKKKKQPNLRPYLGLLIALKKITKRANLEYIKFDFNRMFTFSEPVKFGPAGKTDNNPIFFCTKAYSPSCLEMVRTPKIRKKFAAPTSAHRNKKSVLSLSQGIV